MKYSVVLKQSDEGFAISVPSLPGCHSQGETEAEALENIQDAIEGYLIVTAQMNQVFENIFVREIEIRA
jgi:predicted RNase H-like HicB family nuclease